MTKRNCGRFAIILGAGASHGALVGDETPPLDAEFLAVARQALSRRGRPTEKTKVWTRLQKKLKTAGLPLQSDWAKLRLEQLSTYLEARANMPSLQHAAGKPANYSDALVVLTEVICLTLETTNGTRKCPLHETLFKFVNPKSVLTFNYDLIADQTLMSLGRLAWHVKSYCGGSLRIRSETGKEYTRPRPHRRLKKAIPLLKLHGSMNWLAHEKGTGFSLFARGLPADNLQYGDPPSKPMIVAPVASKIEIRHGVLRKLWQSAAKDLRSAPGWIIWGYSFPDMDTVTQVLCRTALARNKKPKPVIVINPDKTVSNRILTALGHRVTVSQWPTVERFLWDHSVLKIEPRND